MRIRVRHFARYRYDAPVPLGPHLLRLTPRGADGAPHGIRVTPEPAFRFDEADADGNRITRLGFSGAHPVLEIEARFEVESEDLVAPQESAEVTRYLTVEPGPGDRMTKRLGALAQRDPAGFVDSLSAMVADTITCDRKDTTPLRPAAETLARGRGSARDLAALYIDHCRRAGLPARFVSGYWVESTTPGTERGAHVWAEVLVPDKGWLGVDPSRGVLTGARHVPMAAGARLQDTLPVTPSTFGAGIRTSTDFELTILTPS